VRVRNSIKHVCVAARIGEGKAHGEGNSYSIAKTSNAASRGGPSRFQASCAWMRPRSATRSAPNPRDSLTPPRSHPRQRGPCFALRCAADSGCNPKGLARVLACSSRLSAKGFCFWGGDGSRVAHRDHGSHVTVPASGPAANESRRHFVASHLLRMTKSRVLLRVLSQNRDSASRVSLCYGL
jgi:hypothetical protein